MTHTYQMVIGPSNDMAIKLIITVPCELFRNVLTFYRRNRAY